jgi:conjugative transfer signal peptidase TraF
VKACAGGTEPLGKIVLGVAGDTIRYGTAGVVLNGRAIPNTRPLARDSRRRPLAHVPFGTYVLCPGQVWVFSPLSSASWDSRYFGPLNTAGLVSLVVPVWTTGHARAFEVPVLPLLESRPAK